MFSILLIQVLLSSAVWSPVRTTAIFSFTPRPLLTMESLSGAIETEDPKQASTVPPDQNPKTNETDPATDGESQASSQIVVTSPATSFSNGAGRMENKNLPEPTATFMGSKQQMALELSTAVNMVHTYPGRGGPESSSSRSMPFSDTNKSTAFCRSLSFCLLKYTKGKQHWHRDTPFL